MHRRTVLMSALTALAPGLAAAQSNADPQAAAIAQIKQGIISAVRYADSDLDLAERSSQFWVRIFNSPLNARSGVEREAEATRIVAAITDAIAGQVAYSGILGIHLDYVSRNATGGAIQLIDAIDFRKSQAGSFVLHIS
ncbi:MAG: hypothetical protein WCP77_06845 [Roseococcus sp.]